MVSLFSEKKEAKVSTERKLWKDLGTKEELRFVKTVTVVIMVENHSALKYQF